MALKDKRKTLVLLGKERRTTNALILSEQL